MKKIIPLLFLFVQIPSSLFQLIEKYEQNNELMEKGDYHLAQVSPPGIYKILIWSNLVKSSELNCNENAIFFDIRSETKKKKNKQKKNENGQQQQPENSLYFRPFAINLEAQKNLAKCFKHFHSVVTDENGQFLLQKNGTIKNGKGGGNYNVHIIPQQREMAIFLPFEYFVVQKVYTFAHKVPFENLCQGNNQCILNYFESFTQKENELSKIMDHLFNTKEFAYFKEKDNFFLIAILQELVNEFKISGNNGHRIGGDYANLLGIFSKAFIEENNPLMNIVKLRLAEEQIIDIISEMCQTIKKILPSHQFLIKQFKILDLNYFCDKWAPVHQKMLHFSEPKIANNALRHWLQQNANDGKELADEERQIVNFWMTVLSSKMHYLCSKWMPNDIIMLTNIGELLANILDSSDNGKEKVNNFMTSVDCKSKLENICTKLDYLWNCQLFDQRTIIQWDKICQQTVEQKTPIDPLEELLKAAPEIKITYSPKESREKMDKTAEKLPKSNSIKMDKTAEKLPKPSTKVPKSNNKLPKSQSAREVSSSSIRSYLPHFPQCFQGANDPKNDQSLNEKDKNEKSKKEIFDELIEKKRIEKGKFDEFVEEMRENDQLIKMAFEPQQSDDRQEEKLEKQTIRAISKGLNSIKIDNEKITETQQEKQFKEKYRSLEAIKGKDPALGQLMEQLNSYRTQMESGQVSAPLMDYFRFSIHFLALRQRIPLSEIVPMKNLSNKKILTELVELLLLKKSQKNREEQTNGQKGDKNGQKGNKNGQKGNKNGEKGDKNEEKGDKNGENSKSEKRENADKAKENRMLRLMNTMVNKLNGTANLRKGDDQRKRRKKRMSDNLLRFILNLLFLGIIFCLVMMLISMSGEAMVLTGRNLKANFEQQKITKALSRLYEYEMIKANGDECAICLDAYKEGQMIRQIPPCQHNFHSECIDFWVKQHNNCPICRAKTFIISLKNAKPNTNLNSEIVGDENV
ncbi:hypothetical protein niasHT_006587 [Heterodera trifolii]|uniref:RING-type domain-containing protein n=1 Tax=Heterodera trifolii TaxID=157864 RepID=A0ABD2M876_9BILA